ncbi:MAG: NAD(P)H-dependent oxidoreductase [Coriobacteriales bacterium]|jgi:multimeric flavodoxin WrbA|nr:NAD(P)H-dependent oxidoreductase [Coriobacteriales bacterium]
MANKKSTKKGSKPDILFISGSPRNRSCVALIDLLERGARSSGAKTQRFLLSKKHISPCVGCGGCSETGNCVLAGKTRDGHFIDDYLELKAVIERVDAVAIVSPLYFAGPPAQLKALYDRMQPYWAQRYLLGHTISEKRPAQLFVVGGGGDAHGHAPLVGSTKSAMAVAGFNLEKVNNFIGFSAPSEVPLFPAEEELEKFSHAQLAQIKRRIAHQEGLVQRALDSGSAFARFVVKKKQANELAEQLAAVEAELEALRKVGDVAKSETPLTPAGGARLDMVRDRKGELQAEIDLDYRDLISRTPREVDKASGAELEDAATTELEDATAVDEALEADAETEAELETDAAITVDEASETEAELASEATVDETPKASAETETS